MPIDMNRAPKIGAKERPAGGSSQRPSSMHVEAADNGGFSVRCHYGDGMEAGGSKLKTFSNLAEYQSFLDQTFGGGGAAPAVPVAPKAPMVPMTDAPPPLEDDEDEAY